MLLKRWDAREAVEIGTALADRFRLQQGRETRALRDARCFGMPERELDGFLRGVARQVAPLKLNLFKRARLLSSFKWRLREHGIDRNEANALTQTVLFQLYGSHARAAACAGAALPDPIRASAAGIASLLARADARFAAGQHADTVAILRGVLRIAPEHAAAHAKLGTALCYLQQYPEAERILRRAVALDGRNSEAHCNLGALLNCRGQFAASETVLRRAVKLDPRNAETLVSLGLTLGMRHRLNDAKDCFARALALKPRSASAMCGLGWLAGIEGRFEDCEKLCRDALAADPRKVFAWASLAQTRRMTAADAGWLESAKRLISAGIAPLDESALRFAMGKYFDDLGKFAAAFAQYRRANELRQPLVEPYDRNARSSLVDEITGLNSVARMRERVAGASQSSKPVFVVGMMRSGTSLVEQIIASHAQAAGAGELDFWSEAARKHQDALRRGVPDDALATKLADAFLKTLQGVSPDAVRVIDKSTFNSDHLGLIHAVFPNARIIHVRRNPLDTCLSCHFQHFANGVSFTMSLSDLAHYYREHHRLMRHWHTVLPPGALLEVPYAELVADQEAWSRRLIGFIGLEWDARCLQFHQSARPVLTASHWQVRQRIYSHSVGRWRNYRKFLGPLLELRELESA